MSRRNPAPLGTDIRPVQVGDRTVMVGVYSGPHARAARAWLLDLIEECRSLPALTAPQGVTETAPQRDAV